MADRTPPHDLEAERALLGAILTRPSILTDLVAILDPSDFYQSTHQHAYAAMLELWEQGRAIDAVTVRDLCEGIVTTNEIVGYTASTPAVSAYGRYADIIIAHSRRRRLIAHAADAIEQLYQPQSDVDRVMTFMDPSNDRLIAPRSADIAGLSAIGDFMSGVDSHAASEPWIIPHVVRPRWRVIIVAAEGMGKAREALTTPTLTANRGWITHGDLVPGDIVFDETGAQCAVTAIHPIVDDSPCWTLHFSDGSTVVADGEHPWQTLDYEARQPGSKKGPRTVTTDQIRETLRARDGHCLNHAIPTCGPLQYPERAFDIDPYLLGLWLGDGSTGQAVITKPDPELPEAFAAAGYTVRRRPDSGGGCASWGISRSATKPSFKVQLRQLGILDDKRIPSAYLEGSVDQRLALLQGLMDTDGYAPAAGAGRRSGASTLEFCSALPGLADDVLALCLGLGIKATKTEGRAKLNGVDYGPKFRVRFQTDLRVFRIPRKADRVVPLRTQRAKLRYITAVEPHPSVPVRCITVDSPSHLYLTGKTLIATHNTLLRQLAVHAAAGRDPWQPARLVPACNVLYVDVENAETSIAHQFRLVNRSRQYDALYEAGSRLHVWHREGGMNLRERRPLAEFEAVLQRTRPDVVFAGPLYKLYRKSPREDMEQAALDFTEKMDELRVRYNFALILEHHAPKATGGGYRELNPFGSSLWMRWPEFGITLEPKGNYTPGDSQFSVEVGRFRRDREIADWPDELDRGFMSTSVLAWTPRWHRRGRFEVLIDNQIRLGEGFDES